MPENKPDSVVAQTANSQTVNQATTNPQTTPVSTAAPVAVQGTVQTNSAAAAPQDVTASVNPSGQTQPYNPFQVPVPAIPTQEGPMGIRYDFNDGCRVLLPKGNWHVQIEDDESDNIIFACDSHEGWVLSAKKYYIPFRIKVWVQGQKDPILNHTMDLKGKEVQINFDG